MAGGKDAPTDPSDGDGRRVATDIPAVEARLWALLEPYRAELESGLVYGMAVLKRPGAGAHSFFAGVRAGERNVSLHLKPLYDHPELLDGVPASLRKHLSGKQAFNFKALDDSGATDLAVLLGRAIELYRRDGNTAR